MVKTDQVIRRSSLMVIYKVVFEDGFEDNHAPGVGAEESKNGYQIRIYPNKNNTAAENKG